MNGQNPAPVRSPEAQRIRDALAWRLAMRRGALRLARRHEDAAAKGTSRDRAAAKAAAANYHRDADRDAQCAQQLREQLANLSL